MVGRHIPYGTPREATGWHIHTVIHPGRLQGGIYTVINTQRSYRRYIPGYTHPGRLQEVYTPVIHTQGGYREAYTPVIHLSGPYGEG